MAEWRWDECANPICRRIYHPTHIGQTCCSIPCARQLRYMTEQARASIAENDRRLDGLDIFADRAELLSRFRS